MEIRIVAMTNTGKTWVESCHNREDVTRLVFEFFDQGADSVIIHPVSSLKRKPRIVHARLDRVR